MRALQNAHGVITSLLVPDLQEEILLTEVNPGRDAITERRLRWVL